MGDVAPEKKERERKEEKETESSKRASVSYLLKSPGGCASSNFPILRRGFVLAKTPKGEIFRIAAP